MAVPADALQISQDKFNSTHIPNQRQPQNCLMAQALSDCWFYLGQTLKSNQYYYSSLSQQDVRSLPVGRINMLNKKNFTAIPFGHFSDNQIQEFEEYPLSYLIQTRKILELLPKLRVHQIFYVMNNTPPSIYTGVLTGLSTPQLEELLAYHARHQHIDSTLKLLKRFQRLQPDVLSEVWKRHIAQPAHVRVNDLMLNVLKNCHYTQDMIDALTLPLLAKLLDAEGLLLDNSNFVNKLSTNQLLKLIRLCSDEKTPEALKRNVRQAVQLLDENLFRRLYNCISLQPTDYNRQEWSFILRMPRMAALAGKVPSLQLKHFAATVKFHDIPTELLDQLTENQLYELLTSEPPELGKEYIPNLKRILQTCGKEKARKLNEQFQAHAPELSISLILKLSYMYPELDGTQMFVKKALGNDPKVILSIINSLEGHDFQHDFIQSLEAHQIQSAMQVAMAGMDNASASTLLRKCRDEHFNPVVKPKPTEKCPQIVSQIIAKDFPYYSEVKQTYALRGQDAAFAKAAAVSLYNASVTEFELENLDGSFRQLVSSTLFLHAILRDSQLDIKVRVLFFEKALEHCSSNHLRGLLHIVADPAELLGKINIISADRMRLLIQGTLSQMEVLKNKLNLTNEHIRQSANLTRAVPLLYDDWQAAGLNPKMEWAACTVPPAKLKTLWLNEPVPQTNNFPIAVYILVKDNSFAFEQLCALFSRAPFELDSALDLFLTLQPNSSPALLIAALVLFVNSPRMLQNLASLAENYREKNNILRCEFMPIIMRHILVGNQTSKDNILKFIECLEQLGYKLWEILPDFDQEDINIIFSTSSQEVIQNFSKRLGLDAKTEEGVYAIEKMVSKIEEYISEIKNTLKRTDYKELSEERRNNMRSSLQNSLQNFRSLNFLITIHQILQSEQNKALEPKGFLARLFAFFDFSPDFTERVKLIKERVAKLCTEFNEPAQFPDAKGEKLYIYVEKISYEILMDEDIFSFLGSSGVNLEGNRAKYAGVTYIEELKNIQLLGIVCVADLKKVFPYHPNMPIKTVLEKLRDRINNPQ